jgi:hAT family dimerisation domain.
MALAVPKKFPGILQIIYEINLIEIFPDLTKILKIYTELPITSCETERNFSKLSIKKSNFDNPY